MIPKHYDRMDEDEVNAWWTGFEIGKIYGCVWGACWGMVIALFARWVTA